MHRSFRKALTLAVLFGIVAELSARPLGPVAGLPEGPAVYGPRGYPLPRSYGPAAGPPEGPAVYGPRGYPLPGSYGSNTGYFFDSLDPAAGPPEGPELEGPEPRPPRECDLRMIVVPDSNTEDEMIRKFRMEFKSKKKECAVLIVRTTSDSEEWTIAGFSDAGLFRTVVIDDPSHELSEELKKEPINERRIVELATSSLGRTH